MKNKKAERTEKIGYELDLERANHNYEVALQKARENHRQLAEREKEIEIYQKDVNKLAQDRHAAWGAIEKAVIDIWNTKSIFGKWHSKTLEKIRKDLMNCLPTETQIRLCHLRGFGPPNPIPKPKPLPTGHNPPPLGPKPPPPPSPPLSQYRNIVLGRLGPIVPVSVAALHALDNIAEILTKTPKNEWEFVLLQAKLKAEEL